jgi:general stress protein 26
MGDTKNLTGAEAAAKIKELAEEINTCMFCNYVGGKLISRPMSSTQADAQGNIWFLSDKNSAKNHELAIHDEVELLYSQGQAKFLSLHGRATITFDKEKIKELWTPAAKIWFTEGVDDPRVSAIKVTVSDGYYWDTKHGKAIEIAIMAAAFISGKTMDDGIEGTLTK